MNRESGKLLNQEKALMAKIANRDQYAFTMFYYQYHKTVYLFALGILESEELAEEMMQEVMLKIWMMGDELLKIENIEAYLRVMSKNRCYNELRKLRLEVSKSQSLDDNLQLETNETEEAIFLNETKALLETAIEQLPSQQREVYKLCRVEGLKYDEAAKKLNISAFTVQSYMKLALRSLRKTMSSHTGLAVAVTILKLF